MIYLTTPPPPERHDAFFAAGLGVMLTPASSPSVARVATFPTFAVDAGTFNRSQYDAVGYMKYLASIQHLAPQCLFAVAPDAFSDPQLTNMLGCCWAPMIRLWGFKAAWVAQPFADRRRDFWIAWDLFDVLFIGGPDYWQWSVSCRALVKEAKRRGKLVHRGRVNGQQKIRDSAAWGIDSTDGTVGAFDPPRVFKLAAAANSCPPT